MAMATHNRNNNDTNNSISPISLDQTDTLGLVKADLYANKKTLHPRSKDEIVLNVVCGNVSTSIGTSGSGCSNKKAKPNPSSTTTSASSEKQLLLPATLGSVSLDESTQKLQQHQLLVSVFSSTSDDEEEITNEDEKKINMSSTHGEPPEGLECLCTMEDITTELGNYVEYQTYPSLTWHPAKYEQAVVVQLLTTQFTSFVDRVKTTDCQAELRRLLGVGPPVYISDKHAMPLPDNGDTHICQLWYASDNQERSAKLKDAVEGEERQALWDELKQFIIVEGKEPGDDDDEKEDGDDNKDGGEATEGSNN